MDDRFTPRPLARWYAPAAVVSLLLMLLGCLAYGMHLLTDPATLPLDQRAMFEAEPAWGPAAFGIATALGTIGSLLLITRRKAAEPLLLLSLAGTLVWFASLFAVGSLRDLLSINDIAAAVGVLALSWTIFWFARHSRQRGWLR
jgi:hypothetical protein